MTLHYIHRGSIAFVGVCLASGLTLPSFSSPDIDNYNPYLTERIEPN